MEAGAAVGIVGFAIFSLHSQYSSVAPKLSELRNTHSEDIETAQQLMDADFSVGMLALAAGASISIISRSWEPFIMIGGGFLLVSYLYHSVFVANPI